MKIQQIRNATLILDYNGLRFLIDPLLGEKGAYPPSPSLRGDERNPTVELPESIEKITKDIDMVIVTHTHLDHWDPKAAESLDEIVPILVQNKYDADIIKNDGFKNVTILEDEMKIGNITLSKTIGKHYVDEETKKYLDELTAVAETMGIVFTSDGEDTLYLVGDTIWYEGVKEALDNYQPEVIIVNAGGNQFLMEEKKSEKGRLIMNEKDVYEVHKTQPDATIVASHMEAYNHWYTSREDLRDIAKQNNFSRQLFVPEDGEIVDL